MKAAIVLTLSVIVLLTLTGCAPGANPEKGKPAELGHAGFWLGLWQGFIAPFVFLVSLFNSNVNIYEVHNDGALYNFGYLFGLAIFFGGSGNKARRRSKIGH
jgi:hypothetical protein